MLQSLIQLDPNISLRLTSFFPNVKLLFALQKVLLTSLKFPLSSQAYCLVTLHELFMNYTSHYLFQTRRATERTQRASLKRFQCLNSRQNLSVTEKILFEAHKPSKIFLCFSSRILCFSSRNAGNFYGSKNCVVQEYKWVTVIFLPCNFLNGAITFDKTFRKETP